MTEGRARDASGAVALHHALQRDWANPRGWRTLSAVNHTTMGLRFIATSFAFFLIGGVLAMLLRTQLATPHNAFLDASRYNQVFTMHGTVMMFLFAIPMLEGFALYLLPKMLGSRDLAYPRLGAYAYWCYLFGGLILIGAMAAGLAPDAGWFMYTPLSGPSFSPGINADVWLIGVTFSEISAVCGAVELMTTILTQRAAGMGLARMSLFAWYMLVTAGMMLIGFPPLILGSVLLELERAFGWAFFDPGRGGDPLLWQHLFWMFGHPEVYIIFLPAAGIVSTLVPVFARRPLVGHGWVVASVVVLALLSFALWAHHMFTVGISHLAQSFFSVASMLVAVPTAVQVFAWIATLWAGRPVWRLPMLYLAGFLCVFVAGGLTGVMLALAPFDWQAHDTHFVVAHLHYVLVGGMVFPLLAAAYYWMPHVTGRMPSERMGQWAFWLIFLGFNTTFLVMHLTGLIGMPRRVYTYDEATGWGPLNLVSSVGSFVMAAGFAVFLLDVFLHARIGRRAPHNPWGAGTLEWAMPVPAPVYNIASVPQVSGREPLWDAPALGARMAAGRFWLGRAVAGRRETLGVDMVSGAPTHIVDLPGPSWLPLAAAAMTGLFFVALLFKLYWLGPPAALAALAVALRWAWRSGCRHDTPIAAQAPGTPLPLHYACRNAPGWLGMLFALTADAAVLASLLFGCAYLRFFAPGSPPSEALPHAAGAFSAVVVAAIVASRWAATRALRMARDGRDCAPWLASVALPGTICCLAWCWLFAALPPATAHAYGATTRALAGYVAIHAGLAVVISLHVACRARCGYVSSHRSLEPRVVRLWWDYTTACVALALVTLWLPVILTPHG
jgi:cytochrome c oxidase, subunit I